MASWKKQWLSELDKTVPQKAEVYSSVPLPEKVEQKRFPPKKYWYILAPVATVIIIAVVLAVVLIPGSSPDPDGDTPLPTPVALTVEINPAASFITDNEHVIVNVVALNADADVVLSSETIGQIKGKPLADGVKLYVDKARELGFIDSDLGGAVRMSFCGADSGIVDEVKNTVEAYAMESGVFIAVLGENVDSAVFAERSGLGNIVSGNVTEIIESMSSLASEYSSRVLATVEESGITEAYNEFLSDYDKAVNSALTAVKSGAGTILQYAADLIEINRATMAIFMSEHNPGFLFAYDYWTIKDRYDDYSTFEPEFKELMEEADSLMANYRQKYGVAIGSLGDFSALVERYKNISITDIEDYIASFEDGFTAEDLTKLVEYADILGVDLGKLCDFTGIPASTEELIEKVGKLISFEAEERTSENAEEYGEQRAAIGKDDYLARYSELIAEYGSLAEYWEAQKNI